MVRRSVRHLTSNLIIQPQLALSTFVISNSLPRVRCPPRILRRPAKAGALRLLFKRPFTRTQDYNLTIIFLHTRSRRMLMRRHLRTLPHILHVDKRVLPNLSRLLTTITHMLMRLHLRSIHIKRARSAIIRYIRSRRYHVLQIYFSQRGGRVIRWSNSRRVRIRQFLHHMIISTLLRGAMVRKVQVLNVQINLTHLRGRLRHNIHVVVSNPQFSRHKTTIHLSHSLVNAPRHQHCTIR